MSALLSQGGYGCVYHPSLSCSGKSEKNNKKVSKLQKKDWASENEIIIGKIITKIKNYKFYFLPITSSCDINITNVDKSILEECRVVKKKPEAKFVLMKMDYLENISFIDYLKTSSHSGEYSIAKLVQSYKALCESLDLLKESNIVHHDLKMDNILISKENYQPIIIDFGISLNMNNLSSQQEDKLDNYFYIDAPDYYPWPLEVHIINYIVQSRMDTNYGPIVPNELFDIAEKWCKYNQSLRIFSKEFNKKFLEKSKYYLKQFDGKTNKEVLEILLKTWEKWDIYSLSVIYLKIITFIFNESFPDTNFLSEITQMLLINLSPNPEERLSCKSTISYLEDIVNREDSLQDLIKTSEKITIDKNKITTIQNNEDKKLNKIKVN